MNYCIHCNLNLGDIALENNKCPNCKSEIRTITNQKLANILTEINTAMYKVNNKSIATNPKNIIEIAKIIEKGEKKLTNEYNKKVEQMNDLNYELMVISKFAEQMKYDLGGE